MLKGSVIWQVDVAASSAAEAVVGQMHEVLTAAAAGAGVADGLPAQLHAQVFLPLVSSEIQVPCSSSQPVLNNNASARTLPGLALILVNFRDIGNVHDVSIASQSIPQIDFSGVELSSMVVLCLNGLCSCCCMLVRLLIMLYWH